MPNTPEKPSSPEYKQPTPKEIVTLLSDLLYNFSDEIPERQVSGNYKVRANWFQGAFSCIKTALRLYLKNSELHNKLTEFGNRFKTRRTDVLEVKKQLGQSDNFIPTTREEIDTMNALLKETIEELQKIT